MVEIKIFDYEDEYGWPVGIGQGNLTANKIISQIDAAKGKDLLVRINSSGGRVFDGWAIYNALLGHDADVTIRIEGLAASIASIISMAGHKVTAYKASLIMVHKPGFFAFDQVNADDLRKDAETLDVIQEVLADIYMDKTGLDQETINGLINDETWLKATDAKDLGFVDEVIEGKNKPEVSNMAFQAINKTASANIRSFVNAHFKPLNKNQMKVDAKTNLSALNKTLKDIGAFFKNLAGEVVNGSSKLQSGSEIFYEGDLAVGTAVFSDAEMTTALADGDHELEDGSTITVAEGSVTVITPAEDGGDATNDLNETERQELERLRAENKDLNEAVVNANATLANLSKIASNYKPAERQQEFKKDKNPTEGTAEEFKNKLDERREKLAAKKKGGSK